MTIKLRSLKAEDTAIGCKMDISILIDGEHRSKFLKLMADKKISDIVSEALEDSGDDKKNNN